MFIFHIYLKLHLKLHLVRPMAKRFQPLSYTDRKYVYPVDPIVSGIGNVQRVIYKGAYVRFYLCTNETNFKTKIMYQII